MRHKKSLLLPYLLLLSLFAIGQIDFTDSNLPIIVISSETAGIPDEPKVDGHLGIIWNSIGQRNYLTDPFNHYDGKIGVELRGSSSLAFFDKKSYSFETRNEDGSNNNVSLLGLPSENDWVLHGPFSDKSLMRNAITYLFAGSIMEYAPRVRFCEVIVNEEYMGVYLFTEKIKRDKNRVNISKMTSEDNFGDAVTGGYILKNDKFDGNESGGFVSNYAPDKGAWQETVFQVHYPKIDDRTFDQNRYIENFIDEFEDVLSSRDYDDPEIGYAKYIDVQTFIDFMWMQEIGRNVDGYRLSTFMYKDRDSKGGKLKMGPMWDFNLAFGNINYCIGGGHEGWAYEFNTFCPDDFWIIHFWWNRFLSDVNYRTAARDRWVALRDNQLSNARINTVIDSLKNVLEEGADRNFQKWNILGTWIWPNYMNFNTWDEEVAYLKKWFLDRVRWIDGQMDEFIFPKYDLTEFYKPIVSPNPFSDQLLFDYYVRDSEVVDILIYNSTGQLVLSLKDDNHLNGSNDQVISTAHLSKGAYFFQILFNDEKAHSGKLLKF